eukprot:gene283-912_t
MEQQTVSIAKAGITTTLNARCAVLAAANPKNVRYNPFISAVKNMDLPASLLSRFDFQFLLLDKADAERDRSLAQHISEVHRLQDAARTFEPHVPEELQAEIVNHYCDMRQREKNVPMDERREYTTPRSLLGLLRMSQALARLRFSDVVVSGDFHVINQLKKRNHTTVLNHRSLETRDVRQLFDLPSNVTYLSVASRGPMPKHVADIGKKAIDHKLRPWEIEPAEDEHQYCANVKKLFAKFINVRDNEIALGPSTAFHVSQLAMFFRNSGILKNKAGVVLLEDQMMSNVMPWQEAMRVGDARMIVVGLECESLTDGVLQALDQENVKVAALPPCLWTNGRMLDLEQIGSKCHEKNIKLVIDATQALGVIPLDAKKIKCCFMVASVHKWLLGPYGCAIAYYHNDFCTQEVGGSYAPCLVHHDCNKKGFDDGGGALGTGGCFPFNTDTDIPGYEMEYMEGACRFDIGARPNPILLPMILAAFQQIWTWGGPDAISKTLQNKMDVLTEMVTKDGLVIFVEDQAPHICSITVNKGEDDLFNFSDIQCTQKKSWSDDCCKYLKQEHNIHVASRGNGLRIGIYLYNDTDDFKKLILVQHEKEAIRLLEACKSSVLDEAELEQDAAKSRDRLLQIFNRAFESREGWSRLEYIEDRAMKNGFSREEIEECIRQNVQDMGLWELSDDRSRIRLAT